MSPLPPPPPRGVYVAPNGDAFVTAAVRRGVLPQMLAEILDTRVMVKAAMKGVAADAAAAAAAAAASAGPNGDGDVGGGGGDSGGGGGGGDEAAAAAAAAASLLRLLNARQFGLKMIANVTYGYAAASFSGRMPCVGLADAIVQSGRAALEAVAAAVEERWGPSHGASVVYGDTDSLFVRLPGASRAEAFAVGAAIAAHSRSLFPSPVLLQMEKVYQPAVLLTKKRYAGMAYESPSQAVPVFDAKGIETVRRDSCGLVVDVLGGALRTLFATRDVSAVKAGVQRVWRRVLAGRLPLTAYIFRREVRPGGYRSAASVPPAAAVAARAAAVDPRAAPRHGERVPFVVVHAAPGAALRDAVASPEALLVGAAAGTARLNATYYLLKQCVPALERVFGLLGVRVAAWYAELPRPYYPPLVGAAAVAGAAATAGSVAAAAVPGGGAAVGAVTAPAAALRPGETTLYHYFLSDRCRLCGQVRPRRRRGGGGGGLGGGGTKRRRGGGGAAPPLPGVCDRCTAGDGGAAAAAAVLAARSAAAAHDLAAAVAVCGQCVGGLAGPSACTTPRLLLPPPSVVEGGAAGGAAAATAASFTAAAAAAATTAAAAAAAGGGMATDAAACVNVECGVALEKARLWAAARAWPPLPPE